MWHSQVVERDKGAIDLHGAKVAHHEAITISGDIGGGGVGEESQSQLDPGSKWAPEAAASRSAGRE